MTLSVNINDMWRIQSRGTNDGGLVVGAIIMPKLSPQPIHYARKWCARCFSALPEEAREALAAAARPAD